MALDETPICYMCAIESQKGSITRGDMAATRHLGTIGHHRVIKAILPSAKDPMTETEPAPFAGIPKLPALNNIQNTQNYQFDVSELRTSLNDNYTAENPNVDSTPRDIVGTTQLLEQYNSLMSNDNSLFVKHANPLKLSMFSNNNNKVMNKRVKRASKRNPVFTAGISSISKPQRPSFTVPRESINRANLPRSVMVGQLDDQITFGLKSRKEKHEVNIPKFKQMRVFGLDSFPTIDLEKHINNALMQTGIRGNTKVKVGYGRNNIPRRLDPIRHSSGSGMPRDFSMDSRFSRGRNALSSGEDFAGFSDDGSDTPTSDGKPNVVSFGGNASNQENYAMKRFMRNSYPSQYDWKLRQQDMYRRSKFEARDNTVSGICSLAAIQMANNPVLPNIPNGTLDQEKRRSRHTSAGGESDLESVLNATGYKLNQQVGNTSARSHASDGSHAGIGPPPSAFSDDEDTPLPLFPKIMIPLPEEFTNLSFSTTSRNTHHELKSRFDNRDTPSEMHKSNASEEVENVPNVYVQNMKLDLKVIDKEKEVKTEKKVTSSRKVGDFYRPVTIMFEGNHTDRTDYSMVISGSKADVPLIISGNRTDKTDMLNVPFVDIDTPALTDKQNEQNEQNVDILGSKVSESTGEGMQHSSSEFSIPLPRVSVQTLNPLRVPEFKMRVATTPGISVTFDSGEKQTVQEPRETDDDKKGVEKSEEKPIDNENGTKQVKLNSKTLQFVSPMQVQNNAKRQ